MKKKLSCALLALCAALSLAACGGQPAQPAQSPAAPSQPSSAGSAAAQSAPAAGPDAFVFQAETSAGAVPVSINEDMAEVLTALGEPQSYFEAASCAFDGLDKSYTYAGYMITTRPEGEKDFVNSILLTDDSVTTPEGIYIGCTAEEVTAAYGESEPAEVDTVLAYTKGDSALNFVLEDGKVVSIEYLPA